MKYLSLLFISYSALALVYGDKMKGKILKSYSQNYLVLNRGIEDGIFKGEHVKITNKQGYVSRAICIKPRMLISHCKVYRVVNPDLMSMDSEYIISSIKQSEIPKDLNFLKEIDYSKRYNDFTDKDVTKVIEVQNQRIVNFDLINDFNKADLAPRDSSTRVQAKFDKNFDQKKLDEDLNNIKLNITASPLSFQKQGGAYSQELGLSLFNDGKKYDFSLDYLSRKNKISNQYNDTSITQSTTMLSLFAELKDFSENASVISFVQTTSQKFDDIKTPFSSIKIGPIGYKYYFNQKDNSINFLSYSPFFEKTSFDSVLRNRVVDQDFIRHRVIFHNTTKLNNRTQLKLNIDLQPQLTFQELTGALDLGVNLNIIKNLKLDYTVSFISNSLIEENYDLENSDIINTLNLNYFIDL